MMTTTAELETVTGEDGSFLLRQVPLVMAKEAYFSQRNRRTVSDKHLTECDSPTEKCLNVNCRGTVTTPLTLLWN